jgi:hypothetical protein
MNVWRFLMLTNWMDEHVEVLDAQKFYSGLKSVEASIKGECTHTQSPKRVFLRFHAVGTVTECMGKSCGTCGHGNSEQGGEIPHAVTPFYMAPSLYHQEIRSSITQKRIHGCGCTWLRAEELQSSKGLRIKTLTFTSAKVREMLIGPTEQAGFNFIRAASQRHDLETHTCRFVYLPCQRPLLKNRARRGWIRPTLCSSCVLGAKTGKTLAPALPITFCDSTPWLHALHFRTLFTRSPLGLLEQSHLRSEVLWMYKINWKPQVSKGGSVGVVISCHSSRLAVEIC